LYFWLTAFLVLVLDQVSKYLVRLYLVPYRVYPVLPPVFYLTYVRNPGAAFGFLSHWPFLSVFIAFLVVPVAVFMYRRFFTADPLMAVALGLVMGGALGNLVDRLLTGVVTDFLDFRVWPVFNLADSAIVVGVGIIIWWFWRKEGKG
jgi:signal peptidase II